MELDWLRTFLAVVDRGGFSAAAERVHRSQSRVSAHIAALERELGAALVDRTSRPVRLTPSGEVFAVHARDILAAVGSARSAVGAARGLHDGRLSLLTTPCLGTAFLPGPLARLAAARPGIRFEVMEDGRPDVERRFLDDGAVLAVLPALAAPLAGLQERLLWHEPVYAVVPAGHRFAAAGPLAPDDVVGEPLVLIGASGTAVPEIVDLLARHGSAAVPIATADCPQTVAGLVRAGLGVGLLNGVAACEVAAPRAGPARPDALVAVPVADLAPARRVAAYWYDMLLGTDLGRALHREVLAASPPAGAVPPDAGGAELVDPPAPGAGG